jgi:hypothetical protein
MDEGGDRPSEPVVLEVEVCEIGQRGKGIQAAREGIEIDLEPLEGGESNEGGQVARESIARELKAIDGRHPGERLQGPADFVVDEPQLDHDAGLAGDAEPRALIRGGEPAVALDPGGSTRGLVEVDKVVSLYDTSEGGGKGEDEDEKEW